MFKPVLNIIFILIIAFSIKAQQNLVPNPSFEDYWECPYAEDQLSLSKQWHKANLSTSDYFNSCQINQSLGVSVPSVWSGHQLAFDGNAYTGIIIYEGTAPTVSEYIQCKLNQKLIACHVYQIRFWASLGDKCPKATNTLGARLDNVAIFKQSPYDYDGFELPPHVSSIDYLTDTVNWMLISGIYIANGGEQYLTIGRFLDTLIYNNQNVPNINVNCNPCTQSGLPAQYYIDSVSVIELKENVIEKAFPNILSDNRDGINDYWYPFGACSIDWTCTILNRWGNVVYEFNQNDVGWSGKDQNNQELSEGIYYYLLKGDKETKTGFIQLVR